MVYQFLFMTGFDADDFCISSNATRRFSVVGRVDSRTVEVRFRKGTNADRIFNLADLWNADIIGLTVK